ncbi:ornithine decarboxylase antizyme-domain-containing protein, partial [Elsinoe ampelina]
RYGAAHTITEECERLFCGTLRSVFLGEGKTEEQDSLVAGALYSHRDLEVQVGGPVGEPTFGLVREFVEVWTYHSGLRFRGFVAEKDEGKALFVFFEKDAVGKDLKKPLMALLELAASPEFDCEKLVACLDRETEKSDHDDLVHDLGWVGFEPTTLEPWTPGAVDITSPRWLMLSMEV